MQFEYQLYFTEQAKKNLALLPSFIYQRAVKALEVIRKNPLAGKPLKGELEGIRSYRIGDYRILYQIESKKIIIIILTIGHRKEVYR